MTQTIWPVPQPRPVARRLPVRIGVAVATPPVVETPLFGGAIAGGTGPTARVSVTQGGATSGGIAPSAPLVETPIFGGALAAGVSPLAKIPMPIGDAFVDGNEPQAVVVLVISQGALAGGFPPSEVGGIIITQFLPFDRPAPRV